MTKPILSISIPTYNRQEQLGELIQQLLQVNSEEFDIVVTNNCSTDSTEEMVSSIADSRVKIVNNEKPVPGLFNMIVGLFNADGKYVIHCNDRDLLFPEKIPELIEFLKNGEYSFVQTTRSSDVSSNETEVFEAGFDSLCNQAYSAHPTGMVFNAEIMRKNLCRDKYLRYIDYSFVYSYLMRELLVYAPSAIYHNKGWDERPSIIKVKLKSGSVYKDKLWFAPEMIAIFTKGTIEHISDDEVFELAKEEREQIIIRIIDFFYKQLLFKKIYMADSREMIHYNLKKEYVSIFQQDRIYKNYNNDISEFLRKINVTDYVMDEWQKLKDDYSSRLLKDYLLADYRILTKRIKRVIDPTYRY